MTDFAPPPLPAVRPRWRIIVRATLLSLVVLIPTLFSVYCYVNRDRLFPTGETIVVYGRETCGFTLAVRRGLAAQGIPYIFADINISAISDELNYKLGPKFKEPRYTLPVVHIGNKLMLTPTAEQVAQELLHTQANKARDYSTFLNGADPAPHY